MFGVLRFIVIAVLLLVLAWWLGSLPGTLTAQSGNLLLQTSIPAALVMLFIVAVFLTVLLRVIGGVRAAPGGFFSWRGSRRRRLGDVATQRGIVALAAGDAAAAANEAGRARKLLGPAPLVLLLSAEAARLNGRTDEAQTAFRALTAHKDMAFLGHRGLLRHHFDAGDHDAAQSHAAAAEAAYPGSAWLRGKRRQIAVSRTDWAAALALAHTPAEVAALATAAAGSADDRQAVGYGRQAVKADPALAPAVVAYAGALRKIGRLGTARKALRAGWSTAPHPMIAAAYLAPFTNPIERAQTAADLAAAKPGHPESELLLAQTALAARLTGEARRHAEAAMAGGLADTRVTDVLAALGDSGGARVPGAAAPRWTCAACHATQDGWAPVCPHCGKTGTLAWQTLPGTILA